MIARVALIAVLAFAAPVYAEDAVVQEGDIPFVAPDTTAFLATCRGSATFLEWLSKAPQGAEAARDAVCGCLADAFKLNFPQDAVDVLAKSFDGTITPEQKAAFTNYETFAQRAEELLGGCAPRPVCNRALAFRRRFGQIARHENRRASRQLHYLHDYYPLTSVGGAVFFTPEF